MLFFILIISLYVFARVLGYGIYELNDNKNKVGGITMIVLSIFLLISPTIIYILT